MVTRLAVAAVVLLAAAPARAGAGNGIRIGGSEGRLHPFLELEGRYDSNVFFNFQTADSGTSDGQMLVHVRPGLKLSVPGDTTALDLSALLDWAQYTGKNASDLSKLYAEARLGVTVNQRGPIGLEVDDLFRRSDRPQALSLGYGVISNYNALDIRLPWRPGGGALTVGVNGSWALETFESFYSGASCDPAQVALCDPSVLKDLGYNDVRGGADLRWRFLPRTAAVLEGSYFTRLPNTTTVNGAAIATEISGYRAATGVTGLITAHLAGTLKAGYASTTAGPSLGTFLAVAEGEWIPTEVSSVKLRYTHDLGVDPGTAFALYGTNRVALDARSLLGGRFLLRAVASWELLDYTGSSASTQLILVEPSVGVEVARWFRIEAAYAFTKRSSSDLPVGTAIPAFDFSKSEGWLKAVLTY
jgi:hypothetical protein